MLQKEGQRAGNINFGSKLHITRCNTLFYTNIQHNRKEINIHQCLFTPINESVFTFQPRWNADGGTSHACSATIRAVSGLPGSERPRPGASRQAGHAEPWQQPHHPGMASCLIPLFPTLLKHKRKREGKKPERNVFAFHWRLLICITCYYCSGCVVLGRKLTAISCNVF